MKVSSIPQPLTWSWKLGIRQPDWTQMLENLHCYSALGQVQLQKACRKGYLELPVVRLNSRSYYRPVKSDALFRVCKQTSNKGGTDNRLDKLDQILYCLISWVVNQNYQNTMVYHEYFRWYLDLGRPPQPKRLETSSALLPPKKHGFLGKVQFYWDM